MASGKYILDCGHAHYADEHCAVMLCWNYASKCGLHGIVQTSDRCNRGRGDEMPLLHRTMNLRYVIEGMPEGSPPGEYTVVYDRIEDDIVYYKYKEAE